MVCYDENCTSRGLICSICMFDRHRDHKVCDLEFFKDKFVREYCSHQDPGKFSRLIAKKNQYLEEQQNILNCLDEFLELTTKLISQYKSSIRKTFEKDGLSNTIENYIYVQKILAT